jgi:hypothetical protein
VLTVTAALQMQNVSSGHAVKQTHGEIHYWVGLLCFYAGGEFDHDNPLCVNYPIAGQARQQQLNPVLAIQPMFFAKHSETSIAFHLLLSHSQRPSHDGKQSIKPL